MQQKECDFLALYDTSSFIDPKIASRCKKGFTEERQRAEGRRQKGREPRMCPMP
jgi:hypothetical protein